MQNLGAFLRRLRRPSVFQRIQHRLLFSYLLIFVLILAIFAVEIRTVFTRSLEGRYRERLFSLARNASSDMEFVDGRLIVKGDFSTQELNINNQALQWFDLQGNLVRTKGQDILDRPFSTDHIKQVNVDDQRVQGIIFPVVSINSDRVIGYVRASQSPEDLDKTLRDLDLGLWGSIFVALLLSGAGGVLLTRQAMRPIEQSFKRLQQFTADASHELRGPLMAVQSNITVALKYPEGIRETDAAKFKAITSAVNQMTQLTEDLLLLARTEQSPRRERKPIDLSATLDGLVKPYASQAQEKQIRLKARLSTPLYLLGEPVQLSRLFSNLLENALQYTPEGGTIEVRATSIGHQIQISIQDTGIGISPEHLEQVFDRFWRADRARSYRKGGSGLGLAIAQAIARSHGGTVTVTSQLGIGSCFTVRLPACVPPLKVTPEINSR